MDEITVDDLLRNFNYNPETGVITWKIRPSRAQQAGNIAGTLHPDGYRILRLRYRPIMAHRAAWAMSTGAWPAYDIDHRNGVRDDNCLSNLRDVPHAINAQNLRSARKGSTSGVLGVGPHNGRWRARLRISGKLHLLGTFDTIAEASAAYMTARRSMFEGNTI